MVRFLNLIAGEPDIARVPIMIDSSKWEVIEAGLKCIQGKGIVNSISLKEGEDAFRHQAKLVRRYGAAAVVMAFDEPARPTPTSARPTSAQRAYRILVDEVRLPAEDIIFDPNIFAIATGIEEHNNYAVDFIEATRWIKAHLPGAKVSGGVQRELQLPRQRPGARGHPHRVPVPRHPAGMDMGHRQRRHDRRLRPARCRAARAVEDVVLNRRADAGERLGGDRRKRGGAAKDSARPAWRNAPTVEERLSHALVHGITDFIVEDTEEAAARAAGRRCTSSKAR